MSCYRAEVTSSGALRLRSVAALLAVCAGVVACGANVSKTYESDVRFERCYSLDWGDVDPNIRRRCWEEWAEHYSEGQPRDRVAFAKRQLGEGPAEATSNAQLALVASASGSPTTGEPVKTAPALPQPTSVFAPMPMMAKPDASVTAVATPPAPRTPCEERCDRSLEACLGGCGSPVCEGFCAQKHGRCTPKCAAGLQAPSKKGGPARR